jgi:hypothetical protein
VTARALALLGLTAAACGLGWLAGTRRRALPAGPLLAAHQHAGDLARRLAAAERANEQAFRHGWAAGAAHRRGCPCGVGGAETPGARRRRSSAGGGP